MYDTLISLIQPLKEMIAYVVSFVPTLFIGLGILTVGWLVARTIRKLCNELFKLIRFDKVIGGMGLSRILRIGGIKHKPSEMLSCAVYSVFMVFTLILSIKAFGFNIADSVITELMAFVPNVVKGVLVLIIGMLLAKMVSGIVYVTAKNTDMPIPETLSTLTKWAIVAYVTIVFLKEIGFVELFTGPHYTIFITGVVLALALAFGLAGKDIAHRYLDVFNVKKEHHG